MILQIFQKCSVFAYWYTSDGHGTQHATHPDRNIFWVIQLDMQSCYNLLGLGTIPQIMYIGYAYGGIMKHIITIGQLMFRNYVNDITFPFTRGIPIAWLSDSIIKIQLKT